MPKMSGIRQSVKSSLGNEIKFYYILLQVALAKEKDFHFIQTDSEVLMNYL